MGQQPLAAINARAAQLNGGERGGGSGVQRRGEGSVRQVDLPPHPFHSHYLPVFADCLGWKAANGTEAGPHPTPPDSSLCWGAGHRVSIVAQKASRPRREAPHPARVAGQTGGGAAAAAARWVAPPEGREGAAPSRAPFRLRAASISFAAGRWGGGAGAAELCPPRRRLSANPAWGELPARRTSGSFEAGRPVRKPAGSATGARGSLLLLAAKLVRAR